ncbi:MAG: DUF5703 domain-containing protein [Planctomycetota bacterium]|nr:DUF5703 domain-containing protein [Planctomycetota bacterium]
MQPSLEPRVNRFAVTFDGPGPTPSRGSADSMPLGNGEVGLNVWADAAGDLLFYIARTDAWSQDARPLKLGLVRVKLSPSSPVAGITPETPIRQFLNLFRGRYELTLGDPKTPKATIWVWVDANAPIVHVEAQASGDVKLRVELELWRHERRAISGKEVHSFYGLGGGPEPIFEEPDTILDPRSERLVWCHRNERSIWPASMKHQGLESLAPPAADPLLHRTFGGAIEGKGLHPLDNVTLESANPARRHSFRVHLHTAQTPTLLEWARQLDDQVEQALRVEIKTSRAAHERWWRTFWSRSWIEVTGSPQAEAVSKGYALQRFISACAGRGQFPIKFNGSLFTADWNFAPDESYDADFRRWGGPYWFQNTRLPYWPMLATGDFEMMEPLFAMYLRAMPMLEARTRLYFNHGGAFFPETMHFWGGYADENYGWKRDGLPISEVTNTYIRWYWSCSLELLSLAIERYDYTADAKFLANTLLPLARPLLQFFDEHFSRDAGRLRIEPAAALETWHHAVNPTPEIAGLMRVLDRLIALPDSPGGAGVEGDREGWQRLRDQLPPLPVKTVDGKTVVLPAEEFDKHANSENPELYAVFPYRLLGVGRPDLETGLATFAARLIKGSEGWRQDAIQAACLGLADEAKRDVVHNFTTPYAGTRFPAWFGPNFDWTPDQDHGNVAMIALQHMLIQHVGDKIILFPAWPKDWNVKFRLHAPGTAAEPGEVVIEGEFAEGKPGKIVVTPRTAMPRVEVTGK